MNKESYIVCKSCGEKNSRNFSYCNWCGTKLFSKHEFSHSLQNASLQPEPQDIINIPQLSAASPAKGLIGLVVNAIYIVITIGMVIAILTATWEMFRIGGISSLLIIGFSEDHLVILLGLSILIILASWRGWLILKLDPPDPYPEGYKTLNALLGAFLLPLFFVGIPYLVLGLGLSILITLLILVWFFVAPYQEKRKTAQIKAIPNAVRQSISLQDSYVLEEPQREEQKFAGTFFKVQKSGTIEKIYTIDYADNRGFIIAKRSALNRIGMYLVIILPFIIFLSTDLIGTLLYSILPWRASDFDFFISSILFFFLPILITLLILIVLINILDIRRITIYRSDGSELGMIKGSLLFTRWRIKDVSGEMNITLRFPLFGSTGKIHTPTEVLKIRTHGQSAVVYGLNENLFYTVHSLDSIYVRKSFRIDSNDLLSPLLTCLSSICIIERMYKPQSESSDGCGCD